MKKHLLYAALFVGALSSCSKDNDRISTPATGEENADLQEIKLAVSGAEAFNVQTRGTGVVGGLGTQDDPNNWNGQTLYVLMTDSGTVNKVESKDAGYSYTNMPADILWNVPVTAPTETATGLVTGGGETQPHFYYPISGNYDFYGYHVDDAVTDPEPTVSGKDLNLEVVIDGTQDLLVAKADWTQDVEKATGEFYPNVGGYKYGAYAARRGVQPTLSFQHLLTQLQFTVENKSEEYDITVKSINVTSKTNATMTVAGENFSSIVWGTNTSSLEVKQKATDGDEPKEMVDLVEVTLEKVGSTEEGAKPDEKIGNLLVAASKKDADTDGELITEYRGTITLQQTLNATIETESTQSVTKGVVVEQTVPFTIALPATSVHPNFLAGHAYQVKIYVYGLSLIKVTAELTAWENGGSFEVTPEDQVNTGENATFTPTEEDRAAALAYESIKLYNTLSSNKLFDEKCDTLLAFLASGYTTRAQGLIYDAETYGKIDFTPYEDAEGNVNIESTLTAKINWKDHYVVTDEASWTALLPTHYREGREFTEESTAPTLPWLCVEFDPVLADNVSFTVESDIEDFETYEVSAVDFGAEAGKTISLATFSQAEVGGEFVSGSTWTVTVNVTTEEETETQEFEFVIE